MHQAPCPREVRVDWRRVPGPGPHNQPIRGCCAALHHALRNRCPEPRTTRGTGFALTSHPHVTHVHHHHHHPRPRPTHPHPTNHPTARTNPPTGPPPTRDPTHHPIDAPLRTRPAQNRLTGTDTRVAHRKPLLCHRGGECAGADVAAHSCGEMCTCGDSGKPKLPSAYSQTEPLTPHQRPQSRATPIPT